MRNMEHLLEDHDEKIEVIFEAIRQLLETEAKPRKIYPVKCAKRLHIVEI